MTKKRTMSLTVRPRRNGPISITGPGREIVEKMLANGCSRATVSATLGIAETTGAGAFRRWPTSDRIGRRSTARANGPRASMNGRLRCFWRRRAVICHSDTYRYGLPYRYQIDTVISKALKSWATYRSYRFTASAEFSRENVSLRLDPPSPGSFSEAEYIGKIGKIGKYINKSNSYSRPICLPITDIRPAASDPVYLGFWEGLRLPVSVTHQKDRLTLSKPVASHAVQQSQLLRLRLWAIKTERKTA